MISNVKQVSQEYFTLLYIFCLHNQPTHRKIKCTHMWCVRSHKMPLKITLFFHFIKRNFHIRWNTSTLSAHTSRAHVWIQLVSKAELLVALRHEIRIALNMHFITKYYLKCVYICWNWGDKHNGLSFDNNAWKSSHYGVFSVRFPNKLPPIELYVCDRKWKIRAHRYNIMNELTYSCRHLTAHTNKLNKRNDCALENGAFLIAYRSRSDDILSKNGFITIRDCFILTMRSMVDHDWKRDGIDSIHYSNFNSFNLIYKWLKNESSQNICI